MFQESANVVAIIGFVHHSGVQPAGFWHSFPNGWEGGCVMALAGTQRKRNGDSFIGASGVQFGCQSAAGFSYRLLGFAGEGNQQRGQNKSGKSFHKSVLFIVQKEKRIQIRLASLKCVFWENFPSLPPVRKESRSSLAFAAGDWEKMQRAGVVFQRRPFFFGKCFWD